MMTSRQIRMNGLYLMFGDLPPNHYFYDLRFSGLYGVRQLFCMIVLGRYPSFMVD